MNCETWQLFKRNLALKALQHKMDVEEAGGKEVLLDAMRKLGEKWGDESTSEERRAAIDVSDSMTHLVRDKIMLDYLSVFDESHIFEIDDVQLRLIQLTEKPSSRRIVEDLHLPFNTVFLDVRMPAPKALVEWYPDKKEREICGIFLMQLNLDDAWVNRNDVLRWQPNSSKTDVAERARIAFVAFLWRNEDGWGINDLSLPLNKLGEKEFPSYSKITGDMLEWWQGFVMNFLLFVNHPDVELVERVRGNPKSEARRLKKGKIVLPNSTRIVLTGKLKRYVDAMGESLAGPGFDHKFWVRGHWRHHRAARYKDAKGKVLWIEPYIKGSGPFKDTTYALKKEEGTA